jgi:hypothetical protein
VACLELKDVGVKRHDIATGVPFFRQRIVEVRIITRRSWLVWRQGIVQRLLLFFDSTLKYDSESAK